MTSPVTLTCATCGIAYEHVPSPKGGKPPKHCPAHRKVRGEVRDAKGAADRRRARRAAQAKGKQAEAVAADAFQVADLAAALSVFGDPVEAARFVGVAASGRQLERLVEQAKAQHAGVVEGDPAELGRRLVAGLHLMLNSTVRQRFDIAPRDLPHVARALSQIHVAIVGDKTPRVAELTMLVVGADGKPFDPNATPQPESKGE